MITTADDATMPVLLDLNDRVQAALTEFDYVFKHGPRPKTAASTAASTAAKPGWSTYTHHTATCSIDASESVPMSGDRQQCSVGVV
jgi:hypothetical protein